MFKKLIVSSICLTLAASLLVGCGTPGNTDVHINDTSASAQQNENAVPVSNAEEEAALPVQSLTTVWNQYGSDKTVANQRMYDIQYNDNGSKNIIVLDQDSSSWEYLCAKDGCDHQTENCNSYIDFPASVQVFALNDRLFIVYEGDTSTIEQAEFDGSGRKSIVTLTSEQIFGDFFAGNQDFLYYSVAGVAGYGIQGVNLATGLPVEVMPADTSDYIQNTAGNQFVVTHSQELTGGENENYLYNVRFDLVSQTGERTEGVFSTDTNALGTWTVHDNTLYYVNKQTNKVCGVDLRSGSETDLFDIPDGASAVFGGVYGSVLMLDVTILAEFKENDVASRIAYDINTGTTIECNATGPLASNRVVASLGDFVLMETRTSLGTQIVDGPAGEQEMPTELHDYALVSITSYLGNETIDFTTVQYPKFIT